MRLHALVLMLCLRFSRRAAASPALGRDADGCLLKISSFAAQAEARARPDIARKVLRAFPAARRHAPTRNCVDGGLLCEDEGTQIS